MPSISASDLQIFVQIGGQILPILVTTIEQFRKIFAEQDIDPEVYARIDAAYTDRIAQAEREAASHS